MKNKYIKIILITLIVVVAVFAACACTVQEEILVAQNKVVGRFADGMEIMEILPIPTHAVDFAKQTRCSKKFYIDNRVNGLHLTGLYVPKGETITVKVSEETARDNHKLFINANMSNQEEYIISKPTIEINSEIGGIIDLDIKAQGATLNSFEIVIVGAVQSPYYRYGIDKYDGEKTRPQTDSNDEDILAVLDCANVRFYIPNKYLNNIKNLYNTLFWWRNSVELINKTQKTSFSDGNYQPILIYVGEGINTHNVIYCPIDKVDSIINYDNLLNGSAQDILFDISYQKALKTGKFTDETLRLSYSHAVSFVSNLSFVDNTSEMLPDSLKIYSNGYQNLNHLLKDGLSSTDYFQGFYADLLQSFGLDNIMQLLTIDTDAPILDDISTVVDRLIEVAVDVLKLDIRPLLEICGFTLSQEQSDMLNKMLNDKQISVYYPTHTPFTYGSIIDENQLGNIVPLGRATRFDFANNIISTKKEGWEFVSVEGSHGKWQQIEAGVYDYTPDINYLSDHFSIKLKNGDDIVVLKGKITVDVNVAEHVVYNNVDFKDVDSAVKSYKKLVPNEVTSLDAAIIPKAELKSTNEYSFYITRGTFKVPATGKYKLYLKSSGWCKVDFGVEMATNTLFSNILTVNEYTDELSREFTLQKDVLYEYQIYNLNNTDAAWAELGISDDIFSVRSIPKDWLYYSGCDQNDNYKYVEPKFEITGFDKILELDNAYSQSDFKIESISNQKTDTDKESLLDNNPNTFIQSVGAFKKHELIINNLLGKHINSFSLNLDNIMFETGKTIECAISVSNDNSSFEFLNKVVLKKGINDYQIYANPNHNFIKLIISSKESFVLKLSEVSFGNKLPESVIVPNTSNMIDYRGIWSREHNYLSINGSVNESKEKNCFASFEFYGKTFAMFATKGEKFGKTIVEVDGVKYDIDLFSQSTECNSLVFSINFDNEGKHRIRIMPSDRDSYVNIDYLAYIPTDIPATPPMSNGKLVAIVIFPAIIIVATAVFVFIDLADRKKKKLARYGSGLPEERIKSLDLDAQAEIACDIAGVSNVKLDSNVDINTKVRKKQKVKLADNNVDIVADNKNAKESDISNTQEKQKATEQVKSVKKSKNDIVSDNVAQSKSSKATVNKSGNGKSIKSNKTAQNKGNKGVDNKNNIK